MNFVQFDPRAIFRLAKKWTKRVGAKTQNWHLFAKTRLNQQLLPFKHEKKNQPDNKYKKCCQSPVPSYSTVQVSRTRSWLCFPPSQRNKSLSTRNNPHQNVTEGRVLQTCNLAPRLNSQNKDHVKCHGRSATFPRMLTQHSKEGHPSPKIYQNEVYYSLEWHLDLTKKLKPGDNCDGWSATIPWMVIHIGNQPEGSVPQTWNLAHRLSSEN